VSGGTTPTRPSVLRLLRTNDHNSSSSRVVASRSSGSGSASVSLSSGAPGLFEPARHGVGRDAEGARKPAQAGPLLVGAQDLPALFVGVAVGLGILAGVLGAILAQKRCLELEVIPLRIMFSLPQWRQAI
jgi:hypothetical protein